MNSLHKTVTRQRRDCDLNPGPSAPESEPPSLRKRSAKNRQNRTKLDPATAKMSGVRFRHGVGMVRVAR